MLANKSGGKLSSSVQQAIDRDFEMNVEGWEFVGEHALAQEYVETEKDVVRLTDD